MYFTLNELYVLKRYYHTARSLFNMKMDHEILIADLGELELQEKQGMHTSFWFLLNLCFTLCNNFIAIALRRALYNGKAYDFQNYHTYAEVYRF